MACAAGGRLAGSIRNGSGLWKLSERTSSKLREKKSATGWPGTTMPTASTRIARPTDRGGLGRGLLGGDPAADRVADHGHVAQLELVEQSHVERGETADAVQRLRPAGAAEARMGRGDHADAGCRGEPHGEPGDGIGTTAAVQQQERPAQSAVGDRDVDSADAGEVHGGGSGAGHAVSSAKSAAGTVA